jgi:excisionase family DNA binding protein
MEQATERTVEPNYVSYKEAERLTGLSRWTLMRARDRRELPAVVVGSAVRFSVADLREFMEARKA